MKVSGSVARLLVKVLVSAGLLTFLFTTISVDDLVLLARTLDLRFVVLAVVVFLFSNLLGSLQWHLLLVL